MKLLKYLVENPKIIGITNFNKVHVATKPDYQNNPIGRSSSDELWALILSDTTIVVHDIILPINEGEIGNGRTKAAGCSCISTLTGLILPDDLCNCDSDTSGDGGSSASSSTSSYTGVSYGSGSPVGNYIGGSNSGGISTGNNTGNQTLDDILIISFDASSKKSIEWVIENTQDTETRRKLQLNYIYNYDGANGRSFKAEIEKILITPGLSAVEVFDINAVVDNYYFRLKGQYIFAIFLPVVEAAKPFIELALFETGAGVLFQAVKGLLSVRWGIQLAKIGINTSSISTITNRMVNGLKFASNNSSLTLKIGGRNLVGTANNTKSTYSFNNVTTTEAKAIFNEMAAGRQVKRVDLGAGKFRETLVLDSKQSITFRNYSKTNLGETTIQFKLNVVRSLKKIELKFFL